MPAEKHTYNDKPKVRIRKLRVQYEVCALGYSKSMVNFIKNSIESEHRSMRVDRIRDADGKETNEYIWILREVVIMKFINFLVDNSFPIFFDNVPEDDIAKLRIEYKNRLKKMDEVLKVKAEQIQVSDEPFNFLKLQPYKYQKQAVKFFEVVEGCALLADCPGIGKTLPSLAYSIKNNFQKVIIITPGSDMRMQWKDEIERFTNEKAFIFNFHPPKKRKIALHDRGQSMFHIIGYESISKYIKPEYSHKCKGNKYNSITCKMEKCGLEIVDLTRKYAECPNCKNKGTIKTRIKGLQYFTDDFDDFLDPEIYDCILIDECHRIKESTAIWTKIIQMAFRDTIQHKILLSGTPIKSRPIEFFNSLNFLYPQEFPDKHKYALKYCNAYEDNFGWNYDGSSNLDDLYVRISSFFLRRKKEDVLPQLPPKTYSDIPIEMTTQEQKGYNEILKKLKEKGEEKVSYLAIIHGLKQFTAKIKIQRMQEYIQQVIDNGEKIVTMSEYEVSAREVIKLFPEISVLHGGMVEDVERYDAKIGFNNDKNIKLFSGMLIASGVGLNLTAASKLILFGLGWTPTDVTQAEDRIHRANTTHDKIQIITPYVVGTIDEDIIQLLKSKEKVVNAALGDGQLLKKTIKEGEDNILSELIERIKNAI